MTEATAGAVTPPVVGVVTPPAAGTVTTPWYGEGVDAATVGFMQIKGYDKLPDAKTAALKIVGSYAEAEKLLGVPPDQILRMPKIGDVDAAKTFWGKLGVPTEAKDYDLTGLAKADGTPMEAAFTDWARATALKLNVTKENFKPFVAELVKRQEDALTTQKVSLTAKLAEEKAILDKNWGPNKPANMLIAQKAAAALQVQPEEVAALESVIGYARVMELFRNVGTKIGEDKFIRGLAPGSDNPNGGVMSYEQAVHTMSVRKSDEGWVNRYLAGGSQERQEMDGLNRIIAAGKMVA
jgi:hypothetical protein